MTLCVAAMPVWRNRSCTTYVKNGQTLAPVGGGLLIAKRSLWCQNLFILVVFRVLIYSSSLYPEPDDSTSTARSSNFQLLDELGTSWRKRSKRFHHLGMDHCITFESKRTCFAYLSFKSYLRWKIHGAASFSTQPIDLGHRAGYGENIGIHDIWRGSSC